MWIQTMQTNLINLDLYKRIDYAPIRIEKDVEIICYKIFAVHGKGDVFDIGAMETLEEVERYFDLLSKGTNDISSMSTVYYYVLTHYRLTHNLDDAKVLTKKALDKEWKEEWKSH